MKKSLIIEMFFLFTIAVSCKDDKSRIKEDLNTRFTKCEILEINEDSSNIYNANQIIRALQLRTSDANLKIVQSLIKIQNNPKSEYQNYIYIDSIYKDLHKRLQTFDDSKYSRSDKCYHVKYLVVGPEIKTPREEYYHLRLIGTGEYDIIHRPVEWNDFMFEKKYDKLLDEAFKYYPELFQLELKYKK